MAGSKHGKRLRMAVYRWPPRSCAPFSYEIAHNIKLSPDVRVLPCVESRLCVNPAHATQQGERGRGRWSTLTINDVREIRRLASTGARRMDIARRFGLSRSAVGNIVNRRGDWGRVE